MINLSATYALNKFTRFMRIIKEIIRNNLQIKEDCYFAFLVSE